MSEKKSGDQNDHSQDKRPGCAKCCNYMCCCCVFTGRMMVKCVGPYLRKISDSIRDIGGTTLDFIIWSLADTHWSATFGFRLNHIRV